MLDSIVLIGARGGSKRIPNKNIRQIGKHPLIAYSIMTGKELGLKTFVSSDSTKILDIAKSYGAETILRPKEFATDTSLDIEWIKHAINEINNSMQDSNLKYEKILFLRPTTPLRNIILIKRAILEFNENSTSLRSIEPLKEAIQKSFIVDENDNINNRRTISNQGIDSNKVSNQGIDSNSNNKYLKPLVKGIKLFDTNLPNQSFPISYTANGYVDILKIDYILKHNELYGDKIQAFVTPRTIEIDDEIDFEFADYLYRRMSNDSNNV